MTISIHPSTASDMRALHHVAAAAFSNDILHRRTMPNTVTPAQSEELITWRVNRSVERVSAPNNYYFKAVDDETGEMVGGCGWHGPTDLVEGHEERPRYGEVPEFMNQALFDELARLFGEKRKAVMGERKDIWFLAAFFVHPDYQGRGIGSRLLKEGIDNLVDGDGRGLDCYLECSAAPAAKAVYQRRGFESVGDIVLFDGEYVISSMVRKGKGKP